MFVGIEKNDNWQQQWNKGNHGHLGRLEKEKWLIKTVNDSG